MALSIDYPLNDKQNRISRTENNSPEGPFTRAIFGCDFLLLNDVKELIC
jgi:hypothetical protein